MVVYLIIRSCRPRSFANQTGPRRSETSGRADLFCTRHLPSDCRRGEGLLSSAHVAAYACWGGRLVRSSTASRKDGTAHGQVTAGVLRKCVPLEMRLPCIRHPEDMISRLNRGAGVTIEAMVFMGTGEMIIS
jgi:hypothetical protein